MENRTHVRALHLDSAGSWFRTEKTACEFALKVVVNGEHLVTILCSPKDPEELAVGFLVSEGLIRTKKEIREIKFDRRSGSVSLGTTESKSPDGSTFKRRFLTTGCGRGIRFTGHDRMEIKKKNSSGIRLSREDVLSLYRRFQKSSDLYEQTHAVHSAALCDTKKLLVFA